ncbi:MAG TPA: hypothetical protein PK789_06875 [Thermomonas sp.]|uniref:hypothetical protein n=1 Tax=Thermomonas sp. TaxID=1971895 RepID=UPI002CEA8D02|nr:hypothetical protein [Thermomonas sp.]HOV96476.1 hypothetical protein [Thermomonas sp.]
MSTAPAQAANPAVFRGVIAIELRDGSPPERAALPAASAGEVAALLGRDLAKLAPDVADCELALLAAHFDPAEALRPTWPLHQHVQELLQRAPGQAQGARVIGFGADAQGALPAPMQADAALAGGGLRVLPFVLRGGAFDSVAEQLESKLFDCGMAQADAALALQEGLGARIEHIRYLSLHDLLAMMAMQYQNAGLESMWTLLETALLVPTDALLLDAPPEPLARYADGEVRIALLDPSAWQARNAPQQDDAAKLERGFHYFQMRCRQYAAVLEAHGVPVQYVHCADGQPHCLHFPLQR